MVSTSTAFLSTAVAVAAYASVANAHGYMAIPETQFKGTKTSAWVVQIDPPAAFASDDWDGNKEGSVTVWKQVSKTNSVTDLKTLLDGDTSLYGAECGFSDPDGTPQPIPSTSTATFSRAIQHVGPCEIWLDSTKVFSADNCYGDYESGGTTVFPVDYSQCSSGGCSEMRFYWLAFQGIDGETVWQTYKDCIPLEGGSGGSSTTSNSTSTATTDAPATETPVSDASESDASESAASEATGAPETDAPETDAPETEAPEATTEAPATDAPADEAETATPAPSSKCSARKRS